MVVWPTLFVLLVAVIGADSRVSHSAESIEFPAKVLFHDSVTEHLRLSADEKSIELSEGELIEDDGPAAGYSYLPNDEKLTPEVRIKKTLIVVDPRATEATLLVGTTGKIEATINGDEASLELLGKEGNYWQKYRLSPVLLKKGSNEIVIRGTGSVFIARDEDFAKGSTTRTTHPNRSAKSADGGKTWSDTNLGTKGGVDGEYYVRMFLKRHHTSGTLTMPVVDLGNLFGSAIQRIPPAIAGVDFVHVVATVEPANAELRWRIRTGATPVPDAHWSNWSEHTGAAVSVLNAKGRYLQASITLLTSDPLVTPRLKSLKVGATPLHADSWSHSLALAGEHNPKIRHSSIPFTYEKFDQPELKKFRTEHKLDEVVAGAKTEWELITRLSAWSSKQFDKGHLNKVYPAWNAREILKPYDDGTPIGGFCQHYNTIFLQACESFGLVGRIVSLGSGNRTDKIRSGHETAEIWSNDYEKWVYIDGNCAWYFVDGATKIPLSHWELRERQLASFAERDFKPVEVRYTAETKYKWDGLQGFPPFLELRMIPRSNFLETQVPLPLNQGMRGWFWTGHVAWTDDTQPAALLFGNRETRRENWDWSVNQVHITLEPTKTKGEFRVHCDTETPGFETFVAKTDAGEATPVKSGFSWKLKPGKNRIEVRSRNGTGREGAASWIEIVSP